MKETAMATVFLVCILNINALDNLHFNVGGNGYASGIEGHFGISGLQMKETVYADSADNNLLSEIDWNMGLQVAAGMKLSVEPADPFKKTGFSLGGMLLWYFPVNDRSMKDSDWDDNGNLYGYGESLASALSGMEAEGRIAVHFPLRNKYLVTLAAQAWYYRYAVVAHDGWIGMAGSGERIPLYGAAVEYIQEWLIIAPCLDIRQRINRNTFGIRAAISPLIWGYHIDNHYFRTFEDGDPDQKYTTYTDITRGGIFYQIQGDWIVNITPSVQAGITINYRVIENSRGDTTITTAGLADYSFFYQGMAGAAVTIIGLDLTIRTTL